MNISAKEIFIAVVCLIVGLIVFCKFDPEQWIKPDIVMVNQELLEKESFGKYVGQGAGEDIPRISDSQDFTGMTHYDYATVETKNIIPTGFYGIKPWVDRNAITKIRRSNGRVVNTGRRAPEVTDHYFGSLVYYQQYYLVELPSGEYVLAQLSDTYRRKCRDGSEIVILPIGIKKTNSNEVKNELKEICKKYDADCSYTLYMMNDEWNQNHEFTFFIIKLVAAFISFWITFLILFVVMEKKLMPK